MCTTRARRLGSIIIRNIIDGWRRALDCLDEEDGTVEFDRPGEAVAYPIDKIQPQTMVLPEAI